MRSAQQTFIVVVDAGDFVLNGALLALRDCIVSRGCDIAYGDEEYPGPNGAATLLKPGWSPELLETYNYFGRLTAVRRCLVPDSDTDVRVAAEWALSLAASRVTDRIAHLPQVLCWRADPERLDHLQPTRAPEDYKAVLTDHWRAKGIEAAVRLTEDGTLVASWELSETPLVSVVIPNRDKPGLIRTVVDGIVNHTAYRAIEIVIVDNGSTDPDTLAFYEERSKFLRIVPYDEAFNYSRACNLGAAVARGDLLLFLNNDVEVRDPEWLTELVRRALQPGVGVVGAKLLYPDGEIQHAGVVIGLMRLAAHVFHRAPERRYGVFGSPDVLRNWSAVTGACQLVKRPVYDLVGGFDEEFLLAYSDIALCLDVVRAGYRVVYTPYASLIHHESATRGTATPYQDQIAFARRVRALGIEVDPLFHPQLDGFSYLPRLPGPDDRPIGWQRRTVLDRFAGPAINAGIIDPCDDGAIATAAGVQWVTFAAMTELGTPEPTVGWGARLILHFLRRRADLRQRFPKALHDGPSGAFAVWLGQEALLLVGAKPELRSSIDSAFDARLSGRPLRYLIKHLTTHRDEPLLLTPSGSAAACRILLGLVRSGKLMIEEVLWYLLEAAERPCDGLYLTWALTPAWQEAVPDGGSRLIYWASETYNITNEWLFSQDFLSPLSKAEQTRLAYRPDPASIRMFPNGLEVQEDAADLVSNFCASHSAKTFPAQHWCAENDPAALSDVLTHPGVNVIGCPLGDSASHNSTRRLVESIRETGNDVSLRDIYRAPIYSNPTSSPALGLEIFDITVINYVPDKKCGTIKELYARAGLAVRQSAVYRIAYWESAASGTPSPARTAFEFDELWAPTEFAARNLRARHKQPVHVLFSGLEIEPHKHYDRDHFGLPLGTFIFVFAFHIASGVGRKNPFNLIQAFRRAFNNDEDVALIIKLTSDSPCREEVLQLKLLADRYVYIIDDDFPRDEFLSLIEVCDVYVSLHRAETIGTTMIEAMLLGRPVIATRYSGNLEYMDDSNSLLVNCRPLRPNAYSPTGPASSPWAEPSLLHAALQMRRLYDDRDLARTLGRKGQADLQQKYSYAKCGRAIADRIVGIRMRFPRREKHGN